MASCSADTAEVEAVPDPRDAADVAALSPDQRRAWFARTTGKQRWQVIGQGPQRRPPADPRYAQRAACRDVDADLVELTHQSTAAHHITDLCASCPVLAWCAQDAREFPSYGLWAGVVLAGYKAAPERPSGSPVDRAQVARDWLARTLTEHGPMMLSQLEGIARQQGTGIGSKGLKNAADALGIDRPPAGTAGLWRFPAHLGQEQDDQHAHERGAEQAQDDEEHDEHAQHHEQAHLGHEQPQPAHHGDEQDDHAEHAHLGHEQQSDDQPPTGRPQSRPGGQRWQPRRRRSRRNRR